MMIVIKQHKYRFWYIWLILFCAEEGYTLLIYVSDMDDTRLVFVCALTLRSHLVCLESGIVLLFSVVVRLEL